jgi:hypothetical protein
VSRSSPRDYEEEVLWMGVLTMMLLRDEAAWSGRAVSCNGGSGSVLDGVVL